MEQKMKVALVGIGGMGGVHFGLYRKMQNVDLIAVADIRTEMAKEKAKDANVPVYGSLEELMEHEHPDIIDICTPSYTHKELTVKALSYHVNVICEKPMCITAEDARAVLEASQKTGKKFMTAHVVRFMKPYMYLKNKIEQKTYGNLIRLDMKRLSSIPRWSYNDWMRDISKSGGTPMDLSIHDIDFVQSVLGLPERIDGVYYRKKDDNDYIVSNLYYPNCAVSCEGSWYQTEMPFTAEFRAIFENGYISYIGGKLVENTVEVPLDNDEILQSEINLKGSDGLAAELQYFVNCVIENKPVEKCLPADSCRSVELVERIKKSVITMGE